MEPTQCHEVFHAPPLPRPVFDARIGSQQLWRSARMGSDRSLRQPRLRRHWRAIMDWLETACAGFRRRPTRASWPSWMPRDLLACVQAYEEIDITAGRIMSYAGLRYYQNTMDSDRAKFMADCEGQHHRLHHATGVFQPGIQPTGRRSSDRPAGRRTPILPATSRCSTACAPCARTSCPTRWKSILHDASVVGAIGLEQAVR